MRTTDEIAIVARHCAAETGRPIVRLLRLGDANIGGEGIYLAGDWRDGGAFRDGFGGRFVDNQFLGRPYTLIAEAIRIRSAMTGSSMRCIRSTRTFSASRGARVPARSTITSSSSTTSTRSHALRVARNYFDVGGIVRIGPPGRLSLFGASISGDRRAAGARRPCSITKHGFAPDTSTVLREPLRVDHRIARVNALWGVRDIGFARVRGLRCVDGDAGSADRVSARHAVRPNAVGARLARRRHLHGGRPVHRRGGTTTTRCAFSSVEKGAGTTTTAIGTASRRSLARSSISRSLIGTRRPRRWNSAEGGASGLRSV